MIAYVATWLSPTATALAPLRYVSTAILIIDLLLLLISVSLWRTLWRWLPVLADTYFPDLNGIWEGKIAFKDKTGKDIQLNARARIKQSLWTIYIDLASTTSDSHTLVAYPTNSSGNQMLYYVYHTIPQDPDFGEYKGTTILEVKGDKKAPQLQGSYFTIRESRGRIELRRISDNPNGSYELSSTQP